MARAGFDWLVIDMEHSAANGLPETQRQIQVIDLAGCKPLVRVPSHEPSMMKLVLDAGAHGVIVPMVNTREEAKEAVENFRYPPYGKRGVGLWRAQDYGRSFEAYLEWIESEGLILVQIEHVLGVDNLEKILELDGVDGFIVGPYDLSASLGIPGDFKHPAFVKAMETLQGVIHQTDKWAGFHVVYPDAATLKARVEDGYNFIAYGVDFTYLTNSVDRELKAAKTMLGMEAESEEVDGE
jgi:2-dehydro-3-deoxyglucarate aldolase